MTTPVTDFVNTNQPLILAPLRSLVVVSSLTYAMDGSKTIVECDTDTATNDIAITLPDPTHYPGVNFQIKNIGGTHDVVIHPHGGEAIEGAATLTLSPYVTRGAATAAILYSDGTSWWVASYGTNPA